MFSLVPVDLEGDQGQCSESWRSLFSWRVRARIYFGRDPYFFFLVPYSGPVVAVLVELPFILLVSWFFCRFLTRRFTVPAEPYERLIMGLVAFSCLMIGEALVAVFLQPGRMTDFFMTFDLPENRIGLTGQIAFALFPLLQSYADSKAGG